MNGFRSRPNNHIKSSLPSLFDCEVFLRIHTHTCIRQILNLCFPEQPNYFRHETFRYLRATTSCGSLSSRKAPSSISKIHCFYENNSMKDIPHTAPSAFWHKLCSWLTQLADTSRAFSTWHKKRKFTDEVWCCDLEMPMALVPLHLVTTADFRNWGWSFFWG